jgi:hypothetical protein
VLKYLVNRASILVDLDLPSGNSLRALENRYLSHSVKSNCFPFMRMHALGVALLHVFKYQVQYSQSIARSFVKTPGRGVRPAEIKNVSGVLYSSGLQGLAVPAIT